MNFQKEGFILEEENILFQVQSFESNLLAWHVDRSKILIISSSPVLSPYVEINPVAILLSSHEKSSIDQCYRERRDHLGRKVSSFQSFFVQFLHMTQHYTPADSKGALINLKNMSSHHIAGWSPTKALFSKPNDDDNEIFWSALNFSSLTPAVL